MEFSKVSPTFKFVIISLENKLLNKILKINKLKPKWAVFCDKFLNLLLKKSLKVIKNNKNNYKNKSDRKW